MADDIYENVWEALCDTPEEAANMRIRTELFLGIRTRVSAWNLSQEEAARRLGLTRPRLNALMRGKIEKFSLDALVNIAASAGFSLRIALEDAA